VDGGEEGSDVFGVSCGADTPLFAVEKTVFDQIPELCSPHLHLKWTGFQPAEDPAHPILVNPLYVQLMS